MHEAIPLLPNTPSWRGAQLKKRRSNITFTFIYELDISQVKLKLWCGCTPHQGAYWGRFETARSTLCWRQRQIFSPWRDVPFFLFRSRVLWANGVAMGFVPSPVMATLFIIISKIKQPISSPTVFDISMTNLLYSIMDQRLWTSSWSNLIASTGIFSSSWRLIIASNFLSWALMFAVHQMAPRDIKCTEAYTLTCNWTPWYTLIRW